jgi:hypothetical protein
MTDEDDPAVAAFLSRIKELLDSFTARGWEGPHYRLPKDSGHGDWEISMVKRGEPHSWKPQRVVDVWARFRVTAKEATELTVDQLAYSLAIAIAGRTAHEALEWTSFRGKTCIDPHNKLAIEHAAKGIEIRLANQEAASTSEG